MAVALPYIPAAIAAIGLGVTVNAQRQQRREARKAARVSAKRAEAQNTKSRQEAIAERLRKAAAAQAAGTASGLASGSSPVLAETASLGAQLGANIGFANQLQELDKARNRSLAKIADARDRMAVAGGFVNLANASFAAGQDAGWIPTKG